MKHATTVAPYCTVQYKIRCPCSMRDRHTAYSAFLAHAVRGLRCAFPHCPCGTLRCKARQGKARQAAPATCATYTAASSQQPQCACVLSVHVCAADLEQIKMDGWHVWHRGQLASTLAWACLYRTMSASTSSSDDVYSECVRSSVTASSGSAQAHARVQRHIWRGTACSTRAV